MATKKKITEKEISYVGVDVAKATLQVHLAGAQHSFPNTPAGRTSLLAKLPSLARAHVVCEATGGYELPLVRGLQAAQILVSVVNPAQVRQAARAQGQRAKSDPLDARLLTEFGQLYHPAPTAPLSPSQLQLAALVQWLTQLIENCALAKTQAEHHDAPFVCEQHQVLLEHYELQIQTVEAQIQKLLAQNPLLHQRVECLDAITSVGLRTALVVLSHMPELGHLNRQNVAALAGLAPWTRDSGTLKGQRCIGGGRAEVRVALYMCSLSAVRYNPILRVFYQRLIAKGKPAKLALTAVMRKLLIHMNSQLKASAAKAAAASKQAKRKKAA
jgi:transposase